MTDRALSTAVGYSLMLIVSVVLLTVLSLSVTGLVESQEERTIEADLDVAGERLAADLMTADRLVQQQSEADVVVVSSDLPETAAGVRYEIRIEDNGTGTTLVLEASDSGVTVETRVATATEIELEGDSIQGGSATISYGNDALVITHG